jgi:hypothetical protein
MDPDPAPHPDSDPAPHPDPDPSFIQQNSKKNLESCFVTSFELFIFEK